MTARRPVGAFVGCSVVLVALVLVSVPARASLVRPPSGAVAAQGEREALSLLRAAARAGRDPATAATLAASRLVLLAENYELVVLGDGTCSGRPVQVVEARRAGGAVAGRFWLACETGLLLRQQVFGPDGDQVRTRAFDDRSATGTAVARVAGSQVGLPDRGSLEALLADGWIVPATLPGGFRLLRTSLSGQERDVLHLAYSDGLSSLSLFGQQGRLGTAGLAGFEVETVASRPVWVQHAAHERVVWSGGGRVWTLVSDASSTRVREAVATLPRDEAPRTGLLSRLSRGTARLAGLLNPFD